MHCHLSHRIMCSLGTHFPLLGRVGFVFSPSCFDDPDWHHFVFPPLMTANSILLGEHRSAGNNTKLKTAKIVIFNRRTALVRWSNCFGRRVSRKAP